MIHSSHLRHGPLLFRVLATTSAVAAGAGQAQGAAVQSNTPTSSSPAQGSPVAAIPPDSPKSGELGEIVVTAQKRSESVQRIPPDSPKSGELGEIVVTAQKRSESVQRIPVTVTALSGATLARAGVKDLFQAVTLVPGVTFSRAPDDGLALNFRGLGTTARPQAFEQSVALFTDGVFMGKSRLYSQAFFDVDRLEFIKGTQSTLLGKNASLGAISLINRQPGSHFGVNGSAGYEFVDGGYQLDGAADLPASDKLRFRVAAHYNDLNGSVRNDTTGHKGPERKDLGVRIIGRFEPTDTLSITPSYQYNRNKQIGANVELIGALPPPYDGRLDRHSQSFTGLTRNGETFHDIESDIANLRGELKLGEHTLVAQTAYVHYKLNFIDDFDFNNEDAINFTRNERYRQFTQEVRLQSPTGRSLEYMAGGFFMSSHWNSLEGQLWRVPAFPPPPAPISGQLFNGPFYNDFVQSQRSYSAFASATYHVTPKLRVTGGLRYTRETKKAVYGRTSIPPITIWNTFANPPFDPTPLSHIAKFLDGNASVQYDVTSQVMAYASFGHGSKSGGFVETNTLVVDPSQLVNGKLTPALVAAGSRIKDEYTKNYEIGLKTTLLDRRLRLNVNAFSTVIKNFQDTVFTGGPLGFITDNNPARSRGFEVETAFQLTPRLRLDGGLTYADTTVLLQPIDGATGLPQVDGSGKPIIRRYRNAHAPKLIYNLNANYEQPVGSMIATVGVNLRHRDRVFGQRQELFPTTPLTTLDASVGVRAADDRWGLDLAARNITQAISADFSGPTPDPRYSKFESPNQLRTIMLTARFKY